MSLSSLDAYFAAVRGDFKVFLQQSFGTIYPGKTFHDNWHVNAIVHCLEEGFRGRMPRLIINLPPRHMKSFIASVAWPAFLLGLDPSVKIICISYSDELARALSRDFRRLVESDWYLRLFTNVKLTKVTETETVTDQGGSRYATSIAGTLTGRGSDFMIIDDPIKPEDALSDKQRQTVNDWYRSTLLSRLDDKERSVLILVQQRLHVNDLTGYVEASGGFHKLSLPAIATRDQVIALRHGETYHRREGEPLHPERESLELLHRIRDDVGPLIFGSQYQQSPETPEGSLFKRKWFKRIDKSPRHNDPDAHLYVSIDSALSTSETADYSALSLAYVSGPNIYVLFAERGRWDYETLKAKALAYFKRYGESVSFVIEAAASGHSLIKYLRDQQISCFCYRPKSDKMSRAAYSLPIVEAGRVHILDEPGKNQWVEPYINELVNFPHGRFDDQVDSLVQLMLFVDKRHYSQTRVYFM